MSYYTKHNVTFQEYEIYNKIYNLNIINTPKIYNYNENEKILTMENIPSLNVSDMYGDKMSNVPEYIIDEIRNIITILYKNGIEYPDITGYNFIEYQNKIWIIDFEHASFKSNNYDPFVLDFINGSNTNWNPNFD